jgi:endonuclease YncB( thermonuclease family)
MIPDHIHKATVLNVHDGDTFHAMVRLDFFVRAEIDVRLHNYSAPELNQVGGDIAKGLLESRIGGQEVVLNSVYQAFPTAIQEEGNRSFTRWVCDVEVNGVSVNDWMNANAPTGGN